MNSTLKHSLVNLLVVLLVLEPFSFAIAGGIVVAPGAPASKQPTMETAPNGVPIVNIVKPSASGVSHNQYDQFNVATKGVIINNSSRPGVSQLGGAISGNTNFSGGPEARLILNEVTGSSRSNIEGYTEIFGYAAQYILANPNGISVNGGGFINTPKATLTTGVPRLDGSGALLGLDVRRGDVLIDGQGINADNIDAFEIVSRTAKINAEVHAKQLNIIAGQGSYNPTTGQATALAPDGSAAPTVVLDSTALGGMYAQRIKFVGTEAGVGVNLLGLTQATENLTLTADGKVEIKGTASSGKDLALGSTSDSVVVSGKVVAAGKAALTAGNAVETTEPVGSDAPVIKAGSVAIDAGSVNNRSMIVADTSFDIATRGSVTNTGTIYSGGTGFFRVGDTLLNTRGKIYSQGDMSFAGYGAGQRMLTLQNDSGSIESLQGGLGIKADSVLNNNLDFKLEEGAIAGTTVAGGWVERTRNSADTLTLLLWATGHSVTCPFKWDAKRIDPWVVSGLGLDATRNIFSLAELTAAVNKVELEQQSTPNASKKSTADWVKANIIAAQVPYSIVVQSGQRGTILAYEAEIVTDRVTGADKGGSIAASTSILVDADKFTNNVSKFSTATGDITINAGTFENVGKEVYQRSTLSWGRGIHNRVHNKGLHSEGTGQEVVLTPVSYAYGTLDGGNKVSINAAHVTNGIVERNGMFQAPDPTTQQQKVQDVGSFIGTLPKSGLFQTNLTPGHHYLVETNPALTSMSTFYGSDYFLSHAGIDLAKANMQLLGDAFYETNLVRDQIFSLTGKRLLSSSATSDAEQMQALMDSALRAKTSLDLTVGVALSAAQIANLTEDIVWLEKTVVDGHEVLVPKVYLASKSLQSIAQGGSVIVGKDVAITSTGDTKNGGVLLAENTLTLNAANIFNTSGTMKGQTVALTATDSIANTSGSISGGDVSLSAGRNIMVDTSKVTFASKSTTSEVAGQRGSVAATGALSMTAGENISIIGADVSAGGDAKLTAGKSVAIATQTLTGKTNIASSGYRRSNNIEANEVSTVTAGGALSVSAGEDILVTGSKVRAGGDASLAAGENLSITSATDKQDYSSYSKSKKGGLFGGKSSESHSGSSTTNVASEISAGGKLSAEAGKAGSGDLVVAGSKLTSGGAMSVKAADDVLIASTQEEHNSASSSSKSGFLSSKSKQQASHTLTQVGSELTSGSTLAVEGNKGVTVSASTVQGEGDVTLKSGSGDVRVLAAQNESSSSSSSKKSGIGLFASKGRIDVAQFKEASSKASESANVGSTVASNHDVALQSGDDASVVGSTVTASNDVNITAARDVNIVPGRNANESQTRSKESGIGIGYSLSTSQLGISAGFKSTEKGENSSGQYNAKSVVSAGNDVNIQAGRNVNQISSDIKAGQDVKTTAGQDVNVKAAQDVEHLDQYVKETEAGVSLAVSQSVTTAVRTVVELPQTATAGKGGVVPEAVTAGSAGLKAVSSVKQAFSSSASASLTAGLTMKENSSQSDSATSVVSTISANRNVEQAAGRDLTLAGAQVQADKNVTLTAGRDVAVTSAQNEYSSSQSSSSASASAGIGASAGANGVAAGYQLSAALSGSDGKSKSETNTNAKVNAGETLTVKSGQDSTVAGANLKGKDVKMDVGRNLTVASLQDTSSSSSSSYNVGATVTIGPAPGVVKNALPGDPAKVGTTGNSGSFGYGSGSSSSAWVSGQTSVIGTNSVDIRTEKRHPH